MPKGLLFLWMVASVFYGNAQTGLSKRIQGVVSSSSGQIAAIHVYNKSSQDGTITDNSGYFSLLVKTGDTLVFSGITYKTKQLVLKEIHLKQRALVVPLEETDIPLNEVVVTPYNLSGDLMKDMGEMRAEDEVSEFTLGLPNADAKPLTKGERLLFEATSGSGLIPLNPILNGISGRTKKLKKQVAIEASYAKILKVRSYYPEAMFETQLQIPIQKISDFLYFCEIDPRFKALFELKDRLRLWEFLKEKSQTYHSTNTQNE